MNKAVLYSLTVISLIFGFFTFMLPFILSVETLSSITVEDHILENSQALSLLGASIVFFIAFLYTKSGNKIWKIQTKRNFIFLGLALFLFILAGEEISWGQRIFGLETPAALEEVNLQDEINLHNLPLFEGDRLLHFIWFALGIVIPGAALVYKPLRDWLVNAGMPLFPLLLGGQFLLFYVLSRSYRQLGIMKEIYGGRLVEIRELQLYFIYFLIGLYFLVQTFYERKNKVEQP
jgi:hypothetical protein